MSISKFIICLHSRDNIKNNFQEFNPNLIGYAVSDSLSFQRNAQFNIAVTGAQSGDVPFMTERLIERITNDSRVDVEKHWKVRIILLLIDR